MRSPLESRRETLELGLVPAAHGQRFRLLRGMRVIGAFVDLELASHGAAEAALGQHALNGPLHDSLRMALEHALGADFAETSDVPRVPPIDLVRQLAPGEMDLLGVDNHDVISHVEMR